MSTVSEYELKRLRNIEENKKVLASLGLDRFRIEPPKVPKAVSRKRKRRASDGDSSSEDEDDDAPRARKTVCRRPSRRSGRIAGKAPPSPGELREEVDEFLDEEGYSNRPARKDRTNTFGHIPGVEVGRTWYTRLDCSADLVHRPTVAGIHGNEKDGCYSLALSGGYEDDIDMGDCFTYTGSGGRDLRGTKASPKNLRTAPQSSDQTLTRVNLALSLNSSNRRPVRVIRGYKLRSRYAPEKGYRYDGLYTVEKVWPTSGMSGFLVYKYALKRCPGQPALNSICGTDDGSEHSSDSGVAPSITTTITPPSDDEGETSDDGLCIPTPPSSQPK
ncbi:uncharacterized protein LOC135805153 [Sycon ciliatum]|uniref:uncharacterized protein LOC135805153 n=1 Tax=Sycon ciliatum TaxID=27933 RepID=UPI0020ABC573|eukprot:scpid35447/ scgid7997/ E3 ubiquitin-protein ligase UHRF1; Nuclear protein 95; Nuclear zinc finger protein Np95; Ubiquitin-like PHD and RING finger domain-containing protein 1; Ubiquitin-like-containing PHD and RING finger domains protein 1